MAQPLKYRPASPFDEDEGNPFGKVPTTPGADDLDLAGLPDESDPQDTEDYAPSASPLPPLSPATKPNAPETAQSRLQAILGRAPDVYKEKPTSLWRKIAAVGTGVATGVNNANPYVRPVDTSSAIGEILHPGQARREKEYGVEVSAAEQAAKDEREGSVAGARTAAEQARQGYYKGRGTREQAQADKIATTPLDKYKQLMTVPGMTPDVATSIATTGKPPAAATHKTLADIEAGLLEKIQADPNDKQSRDLLELVRSGREKPAPAEAAKAGFSRIISKVSAEGALSPGALTDVNKLSAAIKNSRTLEPQEKNDALAYLAANPTPAATGTQNTIRMEGLGNTREYPVINKTTQQLEMRSASEINSHPGDFAPAGAGASAMSKQAIFQDLHYNINTARSAIAGLDSLDAGTRAQLSYALKHTDPRSAIQTFLSGSAATTMTPQQQEAVQSLALLSENAMTLRSVAGMGQGSEDLRSAILATLPSGKSPSKEYAQHQLDKFEQVVGRLEGGVPKMNGTGGARTPPPVVNPNPNGYVAGHVYGGLTYLGGDPNNQASWKK